MQVAVPRHSTASFPEGAPPWHAGNRGRSTRPIEELEGTWMNVDSPHEQYVVEGLRIMRTDARGTRDFSIQWDNHKQRWQWGPHGRLSLQWLGDDTIAWVPEPVHDAQHSRVWRWRRCRLQPPPPNSSNEASIGYGPCRNNSNQRSTTQPYWGRPWRRSHWDEEAPRSSRTSSRGRHHERSSGYSSHSHGSHGRGHHRGHSGRRSHAVGLDAHTRMPCGLTPVEVYDLLNREITPDDYELLLQLDEAVAKPTVSTSGVEELPSASAEDFMGGECTVCLAQFEPSDAVVRLQCRHHFHRVCITTWLSEYNRTCPLCCRDACPS